jgi:hypothetical protein
VMATMMALHTESGAPTESQPGRQLKITLPGPLT